MFKRGRELLHAFLKNSRNSYLKVSLENVFLKTVSKVFEKCLKIDLSKVFFKYLAKPKSYLSV